VFCGLTAGSMSFFGLIVAAPAAAFLLAERRTVKDVLIFFAASAAAFLITNPYWLLDIPRLAQEQDIGAAVDSDSLRPGDLAVWDGHVAMVVGNGVMVEAGDPVQLSAIRTTNAGQGFQGFWRPTA